MHPLLFCDAAVSVLCTSISASDLISCLCHLNKMHLFSKTKERLILKPESTLSEEIILLQVTLQFSDSLIVIYRNQIDYQVTQVATDK